MRSAFALPRLDALEPAEAGRLLDLLARLGYAGAEFLINDPAPVERTGLRRMLKDAGLSLSGFRTGSVYLDGGLSFSDPDPAVRRRAVERIAAIAGLAAEFGCGLLLGLIQGRPEPADLSAARGRVRDCLAACRELSEQSGVELCLEPLNRYELCFNNTVAEVNEFLEPVNAGARRPVKLLLDTYHLLLEEDSVPAAFVRARTGLGHVHLSDSNRCAPGSGSLDFAETLKVLSALGYEGWSTVEVLYKPDLETAAARSKKYLDGLAASLRY